MQISKTYIFLMFLLITISHVFSQCPLFSQNISTKTKITVKLECLSDNVIVTRHFYIANEDVNHPITVEANSCEYGFFVIANNKPEMLSSLDSDGNTYIQNFISDNEIHFFHIYFPKRPIQIYAGDEYQIISEYRDINDMVAAQSDGSKRIKIKMRTPNQTTFGMTSPMYVDELKVILPPCQLQTRDYINSVPKESNIEMIDGNLVITYNESTLSSNETEVFDQEYRVGPTYRYGIDWVGVLVSIAIILGILASIHTIHGAWESRKTKKDGRKSKHRVSKPKR